MTALFIVLGVLFLLIVIVLLLNISLSFMLNAEEEICAELSIFGKKIKPKKSQEPKEKNDNIVKKIGLTKLINFIFSEEVGLFSKIKYLFKKTVIKKLNLHITVAGDDAAKTAIEYGGICAIIYPVVAFLETLMTVKKDDIKIECDYENKTPKIYMFINIKIRVITLLILALKLLPALKKFIKEVKGNEQ
jgi:hypothetical protein